MTSLQGGLDPQPRGTPPQGTCAHLLRGLHAAAQPLTILLGSLCKEHNEGMQAEALRELIAASVEEVRRACGLFHLLQELVAAESFAPITEITPLLPILQQATHRLLEQAGIQLSWTIPSICPGVIVDPTRTFEALSTVLITAHQLSARNGTIDAKVTHHASQLIRIVVGHPDGSIHHDDVKAHELELELRMAVAEANIRCQKGVFLWNRQPFWAEIELPCLAFADGGN